MLKTHPLTALVSDPSHVIPASRSRTIASAALLVEKVQWQHIGRMALKQRGQILRPLRPIHRLECHNALEALLETRLEALFLQTRF